MLTGPGKPDLAVEDRGPVVRVGPDVEVDRGAVERDDGVAGEDVDRRGLGVAAVAGGRGRGGGDGQIAASTSGNWLRARRAERGRGAVQGVMVCSLSRDFCWLSAPDLDCGLWASGTRLGVRTPATPRSDQCDRPAHDHRPTSGDDPRVVGRHPPTGRPSPPTRPRLGQGPPLACPRAPFTCTPPGRAHVGQRLVEQLRFAGLTFVTPTVVESASELSASYAGGKSPIEVTGRRAAVPPTRTGCEVRP